MRTISASALYLCRLPKACSAAGSAVHILLILVAVHWFSGRATAESAPDVSEILEIHYNSISSLSTARISAFETYRKMPQPIPQGSNWEDMVSQRAEQLKDTHPLWTDEITESNARHLVGIDYGTINQKYEMNAVRKGRDFVISRLNPEVERTTPFSEEKIIEETIPFRATVQGPGLVVEYQSAFMGAKAGQGNLSTKPRSLVGILSMGAIPELGFHVQQKMPLSEFMSTFSKRITSVSETDSGLILLSGEGLEYLMDPAHGWLLTEMNKFVVNDRGERVPIEKLAFSEFVESNSVWYPTKSTRESYLYDQSSQTARLLDVTEYAVTKFEANVPVDDREVDFILPARTVISAQQYPRLLASPDFPMSLQGDEPFSSLITRLNNTTANDIGLADIDLLKVSEDLNASKTTVQVSSRESVQSRPEYDGDGKRRRRMVIYMIPAICIVIGVLLTIRRILVGRKPAV